MPQQGIVWDDEPPVTQTPVQGVVWDSSPVVNDTPVEAAPKRLSEKDESILQTLYKKGSIQEISSFLKDRKASVDEEALNKFIQARDGGASVREGISYVSPNPNALPTKEPRERTWGEFLGQGLLSLGAIDPKTYDEWFPQSEEDLNQSVVATTQNRGIIDRYFESFDNAASLAGRGENGSSIRDAHDLFNIDQDFNGQRLGLTKEEAEEYSDKKRALDVRKQRALEDSREAADPSDSILESAAGIAGEVAGNINPTYLIGGPFKSFVLRALTQGAISGAIDGGIQAKEISEGIEDEFSGKRVAKNVAAGIAFQGGGELLGEVAKRIGSKITSAVSSKSEAGSVKQDGPLDIEVEIPLDADTNLPVARWGDEGWEFLDTSFEVPQYVNKNSASPAIQTENRAIAEQLNKISEDKAILLTVKDVESDFKSKDPVVQKLEQEIQKSRPAENSDRVFQTKSRSEKLSSYNQDFIKAGGGEKGIYAARAALKGRLSSGPARDSIKDKFTQDDIDSLADYVQHAAPLYGYEKVTAHQGLLKLLGEDGLGVPNQSELYALSKVLDPKTIAHLKRTRPLSKSVGNGIVNALNLPRTLMSTADVSAPFRQGAFLIRRPEFRDNFVGMFKSAFSEKAFQASELEIKRRSSYESMQTSKLALTELDGPIAAREEDFMSNLAERIPILGAIIRGSNRAYTGFLNKIRADTFDTFVRQAGERGNDISRNPESLRAVAAYINAATGRGDLPKFLESSAPALNAAFFSPRLISSRVQLLSNPALYYQLPKGVRREAVKDLAGYAGTATTVLSLAVMAGASVSTDLTSSDFLKIRFGNRRYDILAGFQQYLRLFGTLIAQERTTLRGDKVGPADDASIEEHLKFSLEQLGRFGRSKLSPNASYIVDMYQGSNIIGEEFDADKDALKRLTPLFVQDVIEASQQDDQVSDSIISTIPALFGVSVAAYPETLNRYGLDVNETEEPDPAIVEIEKLNAQLEEGSNLVGYTNKGHLKKYSPTDEQVAEYQKLQGKYIRDMVGVVISEGTWDKLELQDKIKLVKDTVEEARTFAKQDIFESTEESSEGIVWDNE